MLIWAERRTIRTVLAWLWKRRAAILRGLGTLAIMILAVAMFFAGILACVWLLPDDTWWPVIAMFAFWALWFVALVVLGVIKFAPHRRLSNPRLMLGNAPLSRLEPGPTHNYAHESGPGNGKPGAYPQ